MFSSNTSSAAGDANFVEDVFSTYLYTGNGSTQTITNGIDLAGKGGLLWVKCRNVAASHRLYDTGRGANQYLNSASTDGTNLTDTGQSFTSTGFQFASNDGTVNDSGRDYVSWTFREQPKFFDVMTYTGTGANRTIAHNLGSVPGCIIVKRTDTTGDWQVYHGGLANTQYLVLNSTAAAATGATRWNSTTPTSTVFSLGTDATVNASGGTYVAYVFAHDSGGFGLTGTDNVISCGSYTGTGAAGNAVTLGYEPQWLLIKNITSGTQSWRIFDAMRGFTTDGTDATLFPNSSSAEASLTLRTAPTATGFIQTGSDNGENASGDTYIYIAIRRGPMKVPTTGTSVFTPLSRAGTATTTSVTSISFPPDLLLVKERNQARPPVWWDKLRGPNRYINSSDTNPEAAAGSSNGVSTLDQSGATYNPDTGLAWVNDNFYSDVYINYFFQRAPSFFDEVCWTGNGLNRGINHNLGSVPGCVIVKRRDTTSDWSVTLSSFANPTQILYLNSSAAVATSLAFNVGVGGDATSPMLNLSSTRFGVGDDAAVNASGGTYVAYLFATCPGVSKVGSYTGTGTTLQVNCGFTGGARFVLIKRTDSTGDWYVWDSARGIVSGNDPYLLLNSTAAEVTGTDYVDTFSSGFEISSTAPAAINANGGTFIFLAIA